MEKLFNKTIVNTIVVTILVFVISTGCNAYKPLIRPNVPELVINEGEELEFTCESYNEINVYYPEDNDDVTTSDHEIIPGNELDGNFKIKFRRSKTVFGDTGWYGCVNQNVNVTNKDYNDPNASWMYVYVRSNTSTFAINDDTRSIVAIVGETVTFPCRPTAPEYHLDLEHNGRVVQPDDNVSFDPKIGFMLKNLQTRDSGYWSCKIALSEEDEPQEMFFSLKMVQSTPLKPPVILTEGLEHVTTGSVLRVKCRATIDSDQPFQLHWSTPRHSNSRKILPTEKLSVAGQKFLLTSELIEENVTFDDEGKYVCKLKALTGETETSVYIHVYDANMSFINLTSEDHKRIYNVKASQPVTFTAYVQGHPTPIITWTHPDGRDSSILPDRFTVINKNTSTIFKIKNVQMEDMGTYVLQAANDAEKKTLNFTVNVLAKPWAFLGSVKPYYALNEIASFNCKIAGNPTPNISYYYDKCPDLPFLETCESVELQNIKSEEHLYSLETSVETKVEMSGFIKCMACNEHGCDETVQDILVSDGITDAPLGIIKSEDKVTLGDDIDIVCAASRYNFSSVTWLDENKNLVRQSDRISVTKNETNYTHRSTLSIKNVQKSDAKAYYCTGEASDDGLNEIRYDLEVHDPESPFFTNTNMNGSDFIVSGRDAIKTQHLTCFVAGLPRPTIIWYKNDVPLVTSEQFILESHKQTLIIKYLLEKDSGKYSCVAKNRYGEIQSYQKIVVKGRISWPLISIIIVLIIILVCVLTFFCYKIKRERTIRKQLLAAGLTHFEEGAIDCINPELTVDDQADLLPYDRKWEFPRDKLKLGKQLGSGEFGVVMKAIARGICSEEEDTTVAVKMVRKNAEPAYIKALASELKIMVHLGKHLNVVNLLGACTNNIAKRELLVIVEYCRYGNLHNYLLKHRDTFIDQIDPISGKIDPSIGQELMKSHSANSSTSRNRVKYAALSFSRSMGAHSGNGYEPGTETVVYTADTQDITGLPEGESFNSGGSQPGWRSNYRGDYKDRQLKPICTQDLLSWAFQVARGMEYLSKRKVLHGDLAARNILLAENNIVKICDFGLAKTMYKNDNYQKQGNGPVPIKWMAIESIRDRVFSTQSDIWSFGIVLWEFFTLAETPYPGMQAEKQYQKLIEGYRMDKPKFATEDIYQIMLKCWKAKPALRPSFTALVENIGDLLEEGVKRHYVDLNSPYLQMSMPGQDGQQDLLTMMSAPDHANLASPDHEYVNSPSLPTAPPVPKSNTMESGVFSLPSNTSPTNSRFQFPSSPSKSANGGNSDGEDAPMLRKIEDDESDQLDEDAYLKPIDVQKKREEFMKQREAEKRKEREGSTSLISDRDSGYCNTPKVFELTEVQVDSNSKYTNWKDTPSDETDHTTIFIPTQDNYVNMPQQKREYKDVPDSFLNPSYIWAEAKNLKTTDIL